MIELDRQLRRPPKNKKKRVVYILVVYAAHIVKDMFYSVASNRHQSNVYKYYVQAGSSIKPQIPSESNVHAVFER